MNVNRRREPDNTTSNTQKRTQRVNLNEKFCEPIIKPEDKCGKMFSKLCCTATPVKRTNSCVDSCSITKFCNTQFCTSVTECEKSDWTACGKESASKKKMIKPCVCVKFNGLQDTCEHPGCYYKKGCLDNPFPSCQPGRKWKCDYVCNNKIKLNKC